MFGTLIEKSGKALLNSIINLEAYESIQLRITVYLLSFYAVNSRAFISTYSRYVIFYMSMCMLVILSNSSQ
jgi:hypothetical protein